MLQQQTVRNIQEALHPPPPPTPTTTPSVTAQARPFGHPPGSDGYASFQEYLDGLSPSIDWEKAAYVQLVTSHMPVCNAVMVFAELALQKSPARRVLLYPKRWDLATEGGKEDQRLERTMRLIKVAAVRYGVILSPVEPMLDVAEGEETSIHTFEVFGRTTDRALEEIETAFPLSGLLSLTSFDHLLYLPSSGLVIDSSILDTLFTISNNSSFISFSDSPSKTPSLTLITPSKAALNTAVKFLRTNPTLEASYLHNNTHFLPPPSTPAPIFFRTSSLKQVDKAFDSATFLSQTGYVQLQDPDILGPEFDIPRHMFLHSRPEQGEARRAWEEVYEMYRMRRMNVCGLDLEPTPIVVGVSEEDEANVQS